MTSSQSPAPSPARPAGRWFPRLTIAIVGLYILVGGVSKLLWGTPNDLPALIRGLLDDPTLTMRLVTGIELGVGCLAVLAPRRAWPLLSGALVLFLGVLLQQWLSGETNCGCFGSKVHVHPAVMLGIDGVALVVLLGSRPWTARLRDVPTLALPALALGLLLPWWVIAAEPVVAPPRTVGNDHQPPNAQDWHLPDPMPRFVHLAPHEWVGQWPGDTKLKLYLDPARFEKWFPQFDYTLFFYKRTCTHCAEHFEKLSRQPDDPTLYVLLEIPDETAAQTVVRFKPKNILADVPLPGGTEWVLTTPMELTMDDEGKVAQVRLLQ
jgi:hypothetical protein